MLILYKYLLYLKHRFLKSEERNTFICRSATHVTFMYCVFQVNPGSKAAQRGIREGDLISSINGQSTRGITNSEAHALLKNAGDTLVLGLNQ